ncbi:ATP-binding protein [Actinoplanes sp. TFC3]|uniref:sensor histidine kinase n=1 Tax=Actinoplanes sp. TFC3 TaxID=1710355 RepID=UPI0008376C43|nr:ATP-binding protein [Actinoplanes sp. TFC3]
MSFLGQVVAMDDDDRVWGAVLDMLDTIVVGCDAQGHPVLANEAARQLFGSLLDGVPVGQWSQHLEVFDGQGRRFGPGESILMRAARGAHVRGAELVIKPAGQGTRAFRIHARPVSDNGSVAAVVALHDITTEVRAARLKECEIRVSELLSQPGPADSLMAEAVEVIGEALGWSATEFWTVDPIGQVLRRDTCWAARGHQIPCELPDQLPEGEGLPGAAWQSSNAQWAADLVHDADAGQQAGDWGDLRGALAVPVPSGAATLGVLVCYSAIKETPDDVRTAVMTGIAAHIGEFLERRRAERYAAELDQTRDEYIALVGHELRTPLTSIQSYTDIMLAETGLTAAERTAMLQVVQRNTTKLHAIVAKLLDVAGMRSGHIALQPRRMNLADVLREAVAAHSDCRHGGIVVNTADELIINGDPDRLRHVVDELLANALTWSADDAVVGITAHADDHTAVLSVTNTGVRIPANERDRVFDLFFRTGEALHLGVPGTGLGLTLARAVAERHGGQIFVSEPDEAVTAFTIRLPVAPPDTRSLPDTVPQAR